MKIQSFEFKEEATLEIKTSKYGSNWPVVYLIHDDKEMYVGETTKVASRASQHLKNPERRRLKYIKIIGDERFNKSAVLDIESNLIKFISADGRFLLQNHNFGINNHNYFDKEKYDQIFFDIWRQLRTKGLVQKNLDEIRNSDLFKFSPYKSLTDDQYIAIDFILDNLNEKFNSSTTTLVQGSAGTGKTVLAVYLMKLIASIRDGEFVFDEENEEENLSSFQLKEKLLGSTFNMALVVPMTSLRNTLKKLFKNVKGLNPSMVIGPNEVSKTKYDLIVVDEAHRLPRRRNIAGYKAFDDVNKKLGLSVESDSLDWIMMQGKHVILFYDEAQSIRPSDVRTEKFSLLQSRSDYSLYELNSQLRCLGGNDYIRYIKDIFEDKTPEKVDFKNFDFYLFDDIDLMINEIKKRDNEYGLSRVVAGYAWRWNSKMNKDAFDIEIGNTKLIWNTDNNNWVNSPNALSEVGCIHTTQGYDLNYVGVIIGEDVKFDPKTGKLFIYKNQYFDRNGSAGIKDPNELDNYIRNIYMTLMLRGIRGVYVYVCDKNLRKHLKKFITLFPTL